MPKSFATGIVFLIGAALLWSLNGALIKLIHRGGDGPDGVTIACYRSLFAGLFLIPLALGKFRTLLISSKHSTSDQKMSAGQNALSPQPSWRACPRETGGGSVAPWLSLRPAAILCVLFFTLMTVSFVVANTRTAAANAIILQYTSTFWIFGLSPLILGEKPRLDDFGILILAMAGIGYIFFGNAGSDVVALFIALAAGLFYALLTLMIRLLRDADPAAVIVVNCLGSAVLLLPVTFFAGGQPLTTRSWILLIIMGVVQFGFPYYLYSLGLARVPAYQAALITMIEPVLVPVWAYVAVREPVPGETLIGGAAILIALLLFLFRLKAPKGAKAS